MRRISSPVSRRSRSVWIRAIPRRRLLRTDSASLHGDGLRVAGVSASAPLLAFLFGVTTWMPAREPARIELRDVGARRTIDDHGMGQPIRVDVRLEPIDVGGLAARQRVLPGVEGDRRVRQQHPVRRHDAAHAQVEPEVAPETRDFRRSARAARLPRDPDRSARSTPYGARGRTRSAPPRAPGSPGARRSPWRCCVRTIPRDRADVHAHAGERREHFRGHTRRSRHAVANDREDAAAGVDVHVLQLPLFELAAEGVTHDSRRPLGFLLAESRSRWNARSSPAR